jgi:hypothetical protein
MTLDIEVGTSLSASVVYRVPLRIMMEKFALYGRKMINPDAVKVVPTPIAWWEGEFNDVS